MVVMLINLHTENFIAVILNGVGMNKKDANFMVFH